MHRKLAWSIVILAAVIPACWWFYPCIIIQSDRNNGRNQSQNNLHRIGIALANYEDLHGKLPPTVVFDKDGKPLYSWRVLLLPFLEEGVEKDEFKLDQPWDSPHNAKLLEKMPRTYYMLDDDAPGMTRYQAIVGPGTAFGVPGQNWKGVIPKELAKAILVVEVDKPVLWSKPVDLEYDPNKPLPAFSTRFSEPIHFLCHEIGRKPGFNALLAQGDVVFLEINEDRELIRQMITGVVGKAPDAERKK